MNEIQRILQQYDTVMHGDAWHGDAIWQILDSVSAECAAYHGLAGAHTIWEVVMHMTFWERAARARLGGQRAGLDEALNFPPTPEATKANWQKTCEEFRASNDEFRSALAGMDATALYQLSPAGKRTFYEEAHGLIQHHVYHAGQIALLKKAFQQQTRGAGL